MKYLICIIIGYALGSIPTAYLIVRKAEGIDITSTGTGNMGAMNSFEITDSKVIGFLVLLIDALKGLLSVYIPVLFLRGDFAYPAIALIFAVFSHCFNPWLQFKGGRGLATSLGGTILLFPVLPIIWLSIWVCIYALKRDILIANIWAIILSFVAIISANDIVYYYSFPRADSMSSLMLFTTSLLILIFIKHIDPFIDIINKSKREKDV
ncbi:MAG: glycerol-3-phosphate acyltransferase [Ignavibacteriaceae bacterium]|jgi:glycerol-3-phosphate acyltransferase PlsY